MRRKFLHLLVALITFLSLFTIGRLSLKPSVTDSVVTLQDGWYVRYNETEFENVKLSDLRRLIGNGTFRGDRIRFVHENVDLSKYKDPTIMFETRFSSFEIYLNERKVEQKFTTHLMRDKFIGCENNFVILPESSEPVSITIELRIAEDGAYGFYDAPVIGRYEDVFKYEIYQHIFIFTVSAFLIVFGFIFLLIGHGFGGDFPEIRMLMFSAILFMDMGVWFLTQFKLLDLFMETDGRQTEAEYITLFLVVPIMYMVIGSMREYFKRKVFLVFAIAGTLVSIVPIFLHYSYGIYMNRMLMLYQLNAMILIAVMAALIFVDRKNKRITPSQKIQLMGQSMLAVCFLVNVFFYYLEVAGIMKQIMLSKKIVPIGAMSMVFATLVNYSIYISASYARKKEYESLAHYAYADGLTGVPNRAKLEKHIGDMEKKKADYCVISIDLNGLKAVNDNQGHLMGDKYLKDFANTLEECVAEKGIVARIGGDEFVAVLQGDNIGNADVVIKEIEATLKELNQEDPEIFRSAAFGYAYRHETESKDWNDVYLMADERMYKNKAKIKAQSKN